MSECEKKTGTGRAGSYEKPYGAGYEALASAIIERAAKDYRVALRTLRKPMPENPTPKEVGRHYRARQMKAEVEGFFRSGWLGTLTNVNGRHLMIRLLRERSKGKRRRRRK